MDRHSGRLVDDDEAIVFVDYANGLSSHGRLMAVEGMRNDIAVLDDSVWFDLLAVQDDEAALDRITLEKMTASDPVHKHKDVSRCAEKPYVVLNRPIPKLARKDV